MAVVVGTPNIDDLVKAPHGKLIAVIGDVGGKVGVESVGPAQDIVLQPQLFDGLVGLAGGLELPGEDLTGPEPQGAVLLIGAAAAGQLRHGVGHIAALMEAGLEEPLIIRNAVPGQVGFHLGDVVLQTEPGQRIVAGLFVRIQQLVAVGVGIELCQLPDVIAVVAVLRELHGIFPPEDLEIPGLQALGKFLDLVAGVVDIELPPHICARLFKHRGQSIPQHAAPGVAHVHGAGGIGGDELHHVLLALEHIVFAVVHALGLHGTDGFAEPACAQGEVQEARTGHGGGCEIAALQLHIVQQDLGHLPGILPQSLGRRQTEGGGVVAVGGILGDLHRGPHGALRRQQTGVGGLLIGPQCQIQHLILGILYHIHGNKLLTLSLETG